MKRSIFKKITAKDKPKSKEAIKAESETDNIQKARLPPEIIANAEYAVSLLRLNDSRNSLSLTDIFMLLRAIGMNPYEESMDGVLRRLGIKHLFKFTFTQFLVIVGEHMKLQREEDGLLNNAFSFLDRDGNGEISFQEFTDVMMDLGDGLTMDECNLFMMLMDKNEDGGVDYEEFMAALKLDDGLMPTGRGGRKGTRPGQSGQKKARRGRVK
mmetsp:Transcript_17896/g.57953  ORF Transcript_17896/g.57953 Transcript_17896/m.57953 type:complete len:212 (+) Transcript_17896:106-741(+)